MPTKINFTKAGLQALVDDHDGRRKLVHDTKQPGLVADVRESGAMSLYLYKKIQGRPARLRLGAWPEITVEQARTQAARLIGEIVSGKNPQSERRMARVEHTLGSLFEWWLESHAKQQ